MTRSASLACRGRRPRVSQAAHPTPCRRERGHPEVATHRRERARHSSTTSRRVIAPRANDVLWSVLADERTMACASVLLAERRDRRSARRDDRADRLLQRLASRRAPRSARSRSGPCSCRSAGRCRGRTSTSRSSRSAPGTSACSRRPSGSTAAASRRSSTTGSPTACTGSRPCPRGSRGRAACGSAASACACRPRTRRRRASRAWRTPGKCSWSGAFSYAYAGEIIIWSTFSSSFRKSRTSRTVFGVSVVRNVVFVLTRKPRALAPPDRVDRLVERALALDELVVPLAHPVEVDDPGEVRRRLEEVHLLLHQDPVRAQEDELLPLDQLRAR